MTYLTELGDLGFVLPEKPSKKPDMPDDISLVSLSDIGFLMGQMQAWLNYANTQLSLYENSLVEWKATHKSKKDDESEYNVQYYSSVIRTLEAIRDGFKNNYTLLSRELTRRQIESEKRGEG